MRTAPSASLTHVHAAAAEDLLRLPPLLTVQPPFAFLGPGNLSLSISVVQLPIKIFEGNVYFLLEITPAAALTE